METEKRLSFRTARDFGFDIADQIAEIHENDNIPASEWPKKFPIKIKELKDSEAFKDTEKKILDRVYEAAGLAWEEMREMAIEFENNNTDDTEYDADYSFDAEAFQKERAWPNLFIDLEHATGALQYTDYDTIEESKQAVNDLINLDGLRKTKALLPEQDYADFIAEARECIRASYLKAAEKFELICALHQNNQDIT